MRPAFRDTAHRTTLWLWVLTGLFLGRVVGQVLVVLGLAPSLPPMREWQSGLLPYPLLLLAQIGLLAVMTRINLNRAFAPGGHWRNKLLIFGIVYAAAMIARYFISGALHPERRWLPPGVLPVFFHLVLAAYVLTLSRFVPRSGD
jgi:hypothetical protein